MISRHNIQGFTWIDLDSPTEEEIKSISEEYGLTHIISDDLSSPTPKPHFYDSGKLLYCILHIPAFRHSHTEEVQEIDFIIGRSVLITTRYDNVDALHTFQKEAETEEVLKKGTFREAHIFFYLMQEIHKNLFEELSYIEDWISTIEKKIFLGLEKEMVLSISKVSRNLLNFRKTVQPQRDILEFLAVSGEKRFGPLFTENVNLLKLNLNRIEQLLKDHTEMLSEIRETNNSLLSTKENEVMKTFTIMAFVTFPLSLIAAIFGMNTHLPIVGQRNDFWIILGIMGSTTLLMFLFFRHKKWL